MKAFNDWLTKQVGTVLGSMYFFYFCLVLDFIMLPPVIRQHSVTTWITYIAQTVIQLLALPALQAYQNLQANQHSQTIAHLKAIHQHLGIDSSVQTPPQTNNTSS